MDVQSVSDPSSTSPNSFRSSSPFSLARLSAVRRSLSASSLIAADDGSLVTGVFGSASVSIPPKRWILTRSQAFTSRPKAGSVPWLEKANRPLSYTTRPEAVEPAA